MYAPILEIDTKKVTENAKKLHDFCTQRGVELTFVTKGFSARPEVIRAALAGGITSFADSRLKNIRAAKQAIPGLKYLLIRIPAIMEAEDVAVEFLAEPVARFRLYEKMFPFSVIAEVPGIVVA